MSRRIPSYRKHKPSGQAVVTLSGRDFYLGPWQSQVSRDEYDRLIGEWLANGRHMPAVNQPLELTVTELIASYWSFAEDYYQKNGQSTGEVDCLRAALRPLRRLYGHRSVRDFGPLALENVRQHFIAVGNCRNYVNANVRRIKRMFRWGVSREIVPPNVYQAIAALAGLRAGRSEAKESQAVMPVSRADLNATLQNLPDVVAAMVQFQFLTGCRPGEARLIRPCDIDRSGDVWIYRPGSHKTEHHGRERRVFRRT